MLRLSFLQFLFLQDSASKSPHATKETEDLRKKFFELEKKNSEQNQQILFLEKHLENEVFVVEFN